MTRNDNGFDFNEIMVYDSKKLVDSFFAVISILNQSFFIQIKISQDFFQKSEQNEQTRYSYYL